MEKIDVVLAPDGSLTYEVSGVKGSGCKNLTKAIDAIVSKVLESKNTGEYCQLPQGQQLKQGR